MNYTKIINNIRHNIFNYYDISNDKGLQATNIIRIAKEMRLKYDKQYVNKANERHTKRENIILFRYL